MHVHIHVLICVFLPQNLARWNSCFHSTRETGCSERLRDLSKVIQRCRLGSGIQGTVLGCDILPPSVAPGCPTLVMTSPYRPSGAPLPLTLAALLHHSAAEFLSLVHFFLSPEGSEDENTGVLCCCLGVGHPREPMRAGHSPWDKGTCAQSLLQGPAALSSGNVLCHGGLVASEKATDCVSPVAFISVQTAFPTGTHKIKGAFKYLNEAIILEKFCGSVHRGAAVFLHVAFWGVDLGSAGPATAMTDHLRSTWTPPTQPTCTHPALCKPGFVMGLQTDI